ncbi:calcium-binding protein, partial [Limnohabitans sp. JirII-31]|uniref:calcium-binding protein n=1 Tax=Limnohabitans sp. JirII-31 TaxID=1977908 RepID=UPI000CAD44D1
GTDTVTIQSYFSSEYYRVEKISFADGTVWGVGDIASRVTRNGSEGADSITGLSDYANRINGLGGNDTLYGGNQDDVIDGGEGDDYMVGYSGTDMLTGGAGNDALNGGYGSDTLMGGEGNDSLAGDYGDDTLVGGVGNDYLSGWQGNDTYVFNQGDGQDTINDLDYWVPNVDTLQLGAGLLVGDTQVSAVGEDLKLSWGTDTVTVQSYFNSAYYQVEKISFADGTTWGFADIVSRVIRNGSDGADYITGFRDYANRINGLGGNDTLIGGNQDDVIDGGAGNDTLTGGTGNDTLTGGYGNDIYVFNQGDGADTINDYDTTADNIDTLQLGSVLLAANTTLDRVGNDLKLSWGTDMVTVQSYFSSAYNRVEKISFADGTTWGIADIAGKLVQNGTAEADSMTGLSEYANRMNGLGGNDTLIGGNQDDVLNGGEGDDRLGGGDGNDTLTGGAGNDALYGEKGNDTYVFNLGDGADIITDDDSTAGNIDTLQLGAGLLSGDVSLSRLGNSLMLSWGTDSVTLKSSFITESYRIEKVSFADGTTWGIADIAGKLVQNGTASADNFIGFIDYANRMNGLGGNDTLYGGNQDDVIDGGEGNDILGGANGKDTLTGGAGNDLLMGGFGNDTYVFNQGDGADIINDYDGTTGNIDTLQLGAGLLASNVAVGRVGNDLKLSWGTDSVTVQNYFINEFFRVEKVSFADGTTWGIADIASKLVQNGTANADTIVGLTDYANRINGLAGNDYLYGGSKDDVIDGGIGNDTLIGAKGNDLLLGGFGNDTYVFNQGDGADIINDYDYSSTASNVDTLQLGAGLLASNAVLGRVGSDLKMSWGTDSVTVQGYFNNEFFRVEKVSFADGTTWGIADIASKLVQNGTANADTIVGLTDYANRINGLAGNDYLYGGSKDDVIDGGAGNDYMTGYAGNDTYTVDSASDVVYEASNQGTDTVLSGVSYTLPTNCENLTLTGLKAINGVGNSLNNVLVGNAAANTLTGGSGADQFVFGSVLSSANVDTITDFSRAEGDVIALSGSVFTKLQGKTSLASYFRFSTQKAIGGDDYLVYNSATGQLAYDVTGTASSTAVVFATLINKPLDFTAAQMVVI